MLLAVVCYLCSLGRCHDIYVDPNTGMDTDNCWNGSVPCKTLKMGLKALQNNSNTTIWTSAGVYNITEDHKFENRKNIAIVGVTTNGSLSSAISVLVSCSNFSGGLTFINSSNITLRGISIVGCGALHYSTSKNFTESRFKFAEFYAALYFLYCEDVTLQIVHINNSVGTGAVFYSTVGNNVIDGTIFHSNSAQQGTPGGGGLYIEFSYCTPSTNDGAYDDCSLGSNVPEFYARDAYYLISQSLFDKNKASLINPESHTFILPQNSSHLAFGRGGGVSVFFKGNASCNTVTINNCIITNNEALWGAGLFVEYQDMSFSNKMLIGDSHIINNHVTNPSNESGTGGGGARVGFIFFDRTHVCHNLIEFQNVNFSGNRAYYGGGLSFYTARENASVATNTLTFHNCTWRSNTARVGTAVDLSVWHPVSEGALVRPLFSYCSFSWNNANYARITTIGSFVGLGTLYSDSIPALFKNNVNFSHNTQTALAAVGTGIHFMKNTIAWFHSNTGRNGGAIALMGYAFIEVASNTTFHFVNNSADLKGGAIYGHSIGEHDLISSRNCFIRYNDIYVTPQNWNVTFSFEGNRAQNQSNSIYVTSLLTCLWGGAFGSTNEGTQNVFCWNNGTAHWHYDGNCSANIATSPAHFRANTKTDSSYAMTMIPGKRKKFPFSTVDDKQLDVTQYTVLIARTETNTTNNDKIFLDGSSVYISDNSLEVHGKPYASGTVRIETIDPRVVYTQINVTVQKCPPGMIYSSSDSGLNSSCTCGNGALYNRLILCDRDKYSTSLQRGSWIGFYNSDPELLVGQCLYCAGIDLDNRYIPLHDDLHFLCGRINRTGILCGACEHPYGPAVNSKHFTCMECNDQDEHLNWFFYLLTEFLPITIFFLFVVLFNVSVTSGPANAFVFFAQMTTTALNLDGDGFVQVNTVLPNGNTVDDIFRTIPYDFWNLNFFRPYLPKFCLSSSISTLQLLATGYVTAFYPLVLVAVFFFFSWLYSRGFRPILLLCRPFHSCFARINRILDVRKSILHALATFLLLSYTKFTLVSFFLLTSTPLIRANGSVASFNLYYDGRIVFGSAEHLPYLIPSMVVLATFVAIPPIILIAPSAVHVIQKWCGRTPDLCGGAMFSQFLNAFHGCYKDGTGGEYDQGNKSDCRWFAGLYFILRVVLLAIYAFTADWFFQSVLQLVVCIGALIAFVVFRPYKNDLYNKVDAAFFGIIALLCSLSLQNYYSSIVGSTLSPWTFVFQYFLFVCPLIYISFVVVYFFWRRNKSIVKKLYQKCLKKLLMNTGSPELVQDDNDFFQDAEAAGRFGSPERNTYSQSPCLSVQENQPLLQNEPRRRISPPPNCSESSGGSNNENGSSNSGTHLSAGTQTPTLGAETYNNFGVDVFEVTPPGASNGPGVEVETLSKRRKNIFFTQ